MNSSDRERLKDSLARAGRSLYNSLPVLAGTILLIGLANAVVPKSVYGRIFTKFAILDTLTGAFAGSILAGNPITSYILSGEFLSQGVSLYAVTAFMVAWVTVGVVQYPAESMMLGKRFSTLRNISSFVLAIITAIITVSVVGML
ncbi:MAG: hypothetical protein J7K54_05140 [Candidatus Aenigmarchaeota archaeon]|nr:hypothetical protein [Candidatus Aenigmarchaeota archaeon]